MHDASCLSLSRTSRKETSGKKNGNHTPITEAAKGPSPP